MSVVQHKSADKTVATISARNAIMPRIDHMTVVVLDASGDTSVLTGKAIYKWDATADAWLLLAKETADTLSFSRETKVITNDTVQTSYLPANGVIWDVYVEMGGNEITQVEWSVDGSIITIQPDTPGQLDGKRLNYKYAYGTITQQLDSALQTHLNATDPHPQYVTANELSTELATAIAGIGPTYTHPDTHPAGMIVQDATHRFVTDTEKSSWNAMAPQASTYSKTETDNQITAKIQSVVGAAPAALDTLQEIAAQLASDESAVAALTTTVATKVTAAQAAAAAPVQSVAGRTGAVTLSKSDVGLSNVDNTSDAAKPISTATQTALDGKAPSTHVGATGSAHGIATISAAGFMSATDKVKLDAVANGATANATDAQLRDRATHTGTQAINTVTGLQTALDAKADLSSPALTGVPTAPTAAINTNTTQIATTAYVNAEIANDAAPISHVGSTGAAHGVATASVNGFMSSTDKTKLDGVAAGANNYALPAATTTTLGGIKVSTGLAVDGTGATSVAYGSTASTAVQGNDARVMADQAANVASIRTLGTGALQAAAGNHTHAAQTSVTGNAGTATKLETARTINGVSFDGTANIIINAVDSTARIPASEKGAANGVATLGSDGKIPSTQLPSYVDDVLEYANFASLPATGEGGKIYVTTDDNKQYRWSGSAYSAISSGAVQSVAGKTGVVTLVKDDVGLGNVDNTADIDKPISTATQTALNISVGGVNDLLAAINGGTYSSNFEAYTNSAVLTAHKQEVNPHPQIATTITGNIIDLNTANYFVKTITGATSMSVSNPSPSGKVTSFVMEIINGGAGVITWFSGSIVKWDGGTKPTLTTNGTDLLSFISRDGGATWIGTQLVKDAK